MKEALFLFQVEGRKISVTHFLRALSLQRSFELCQPDISAAIEVWKAIFIDDFLNQLTHYDVDFYHHKVTVSITYEEFS